MICGRSCSVAQNNLPQCRQNLVNILLAVVFPKRNPYRPLRKALVKPDSLQHTEINFPLYKRLKICYNKSMERKTLTEYFEEVETTEEYNGYFCSIAEAISIVVLGSLCGLKNVSQIHQWADSERVKEFLKEKFQINHVPCYYWLLVLLKMVKTDTLNECLMKWAAQFLPKPEDRGQTTISLDGKTIRSTTGMKNMSSPLHIISAQICELGITLASETVADKSNEIPAVQRLLEKMDIEG